MAPKSKHTQNVLIELLLNESKKTPDKEGNTPLLLKAIEVSKLDKLGKEREYFENLVCELSEELRKFNETHFSELDSFINTAQLPRNNIFSKFSDFVRKKEHNEDLVLKACVTRFIINSNKSFFQLDYIIERFEGLKSLDPWLYSELIIKYNWEKGVNLIAEILSKNNDTSYLFALITKWMTEDNSAQNLIYAFDRWERYFSFDDKKFLEVFREQYGLTQKVKTDDYKHSGQSFEIELSTNQAFLKFIRTDNALKYESLMS